MMAHTISIHCSSRCAAQRERRCRGSSTGLGDEVVGPHGSAGNMWVAESKLPSRQGESHPLPLTEPDVNLSIYPARAIQPPAVPPTASARTSAVPAGGPDEGAETLGPGC